MTVIEIKNRLFSFPQIWDELTQRQAREVWKVLCGGYSIEQANMQFVRILSGCGWFRFFRAGAAEISQYFYLCEFLIKTTNLTRQLLPEYRGLYGPSSNFDNLRMNEFAFSQNYYEAYRDDDRNIDALNRLVATLYRAPGGDEKDGDIREPFSEAVMLKTVETVAGWPFYIREMIYFWYGGCLEQLMDQYNDIFTGQGGTPALHGIVSVMRNVAKDGTYGDFSKVELMYVKMFFLELRESRHEASQIEKQSQNIN